MEEIDNFLTKDRLKLQTMFSGDELVTINVADGTKLFIVYPKSRKVPFQNLGETFSFLSKMNKEHKNDEDYVFIGDFVVEKEKIKKLSTGFNMIHELSLLRNNIDSFIKKDIKHFTIYNILHSNDRNGVMLNRVYRVYDREVVRISRVYGYCSKMFNVSPNEKFESLDSFYLKNFACYGVFYDFTGGDFITSIQNKINACKINKPKSFLRCIKEDYRSVFFLTTDQTGKVKGAKQLPLNDGGTGNTIIDLNELDNNKDKYFNYYYITGNEVFKIPHLLAYNRVELIRNKKFDEELKKSLDIGETIRGTKKIELYKGTKRIKWDFIKKPEFYDKENKENNNGESIYRTNTKFPTGCCWCNK